MKRSTSKFRQAPKFEKGGFMGMMGNGINGAANVAPGKQLSDEEIFNMQTYGGDMYKNMQASNQQGQQVESAVGAMGPWGKAIAGISNIAGKAFGGDAYGDYKDNAGGKAKGFFNRSFNMKEGVAGLKDTFKRPTADNIKSQLTLGLWGKSEREKDAEKLKGTVATMKTNSQIIGNAEMGAFAKNSLPKFQAPAYGKNGLKFKSKFNRP